MAGLPGELREEIEGVDVHCVHGSPLALNDFLWESLDEDELRWRVEASGAGVLLCTHTGFPWQRLCGRTLVVNVGAVGRPANDGRTDTWYAVLELSAGRIGRDVPVAYDWSAQARSMRAAALPEPFVETIETGWWTTCLEIVPPRERARGRYHVYREAIPSGFDLGTAGLSDGPGPELSDLPVVSLFGTEASRRACGSTPTSTATWPATTAWSPPRRGHGAAGSLPSASAHWWTRRSRRAFASST